MTKPVILEDVMNVRMLAAGWADSVTCAAANKGPRSQRDMHTNLALVGSPPLLWVAFIDTDFEQGNRRAALAKYLFQDVCEQQGSSHMLEGAASCAISAPWGLGAEDELFETPAHCRAAVASPEFLVPDELCRFDVLVAVCEDARERIISSDPTGALAPKVVCLTDFVDGVGSWPDEANALPADISAEQVLSYTDLPAGRDQLAVMLRSLVGLESFLMRQFPVDMVGLLHPCLMPRSFTPEVRAMIEASC